MQNYEEALKPLSSILQFFSWSARVALRLLCTKPRQKMKLVCFLLARRLREGGDRGGICSGQILIFTKIMIRVWTLGGPTSLPAGPAHLQAWREPKKKASGLSQHSIKHHSTRAAQPSDMPAINKWSFPISTKILSEATQGSDMRTLRSSLLPRNV